VAEKHGRRWKERWINRLKKKLLVTQKKSLKRGKKGEGRDPEEHTTRKNSGQIAFKRTPTLGKKTGSE